MRFTFAAESDSMQTGKQIGAILLLSLLFVKAMIVPALFVNYELRKDFIIKNYCVNKSRPELKCDGQCYLAKQIKAAEQQDEDEATDTFLNKIFEVETKVGLISFQFDPQLSILSKEVFFSYSFTVPATMKGSIFHPPQV